MEGLKKTTPVLAWAFKTVFLYFSCCQMMTLNYVRITRTRSLTTGRRVDVLILEKPAPTL